MDGIENTNDDFTGFTETDITDVDFFAAADEQEQDPGSEGTKPVESPAPASEEGGKSTKEKEEEDDLFTKDEEEDGDDGEGDGNEGGEGEGDEGPIEIQEGDSLTTLNFLKEKGLVEYELEDGEELTDEVAANILEDSLDDMFEERIDELFKDVPDVVKEMNKYVLNGGDINTFLQTVAVQNSSGLSEGLDLEDESNQELAVAHGLAEEGYDKEYIDAQIEFLKDSGRLKKHSEVHYSKWETKNKEEQKAILKSKEAALKNEKIQRRALKEKVTTFLDSTEEVAGFTVTKQDKRILPTYMSDRTVKLENGNQITSMQKDLMRVLNSPTGSVQMAKLLKAANEQGELNFEEVSKTTETKVTKKVRENIRRNKKSIITQSGGAKKQKRPLADYFN